MINRIWHWWHYGDKVLPVLIFFLALTFILLFMVAAEKAALKEACIAEGHSWVKTGETTTYIMVNNILMPVVAENHECQERQP